MIGKGRGSSTAATPVRGGAGPFVTPPSRRTAHGLAMNLELGKSMSVLGCKLKGLCQLRNMVEIRNDDAEQGHVHGVGEKVDLQEQQSVEDFCSGLSGGKSLITYGIKTPS